MYSLLIRVTALSLKGRQTYFSFNFLQGKCLSLPADGSLQVGRVLTGVAGSGPPVRGSVGAFGIQPL